MSQSTQLLRKYNYLLSYDNSYNTLAFLAFVTMFVLININLANAINIEFGNAEKSTNGMIDILVNCILFSNLIRRMMNKEEAIELIDVIEKQLQLDRIEFVGKEKVWLKIEKTFRERREHAERMARNLFMVLSVLGFLMVTRNKIKSIFKLDSNELKNESTKWPTPYISYFSPDFDKLSFFIYMYVLQSILPTLFIMEGIVSLSSFYLSTEKILTDFEIFYILLDNLSEQFSNEDEYCLNGWQDKIYGIHTSSIFVNLRRDMRRIVNFHQNINR
ncbi:hypothetical protein LSTR_LSTR014154 [Laodelphax striatellus]|uniref:Odorant receptor n=1 Tax=Laodelphax striatellus TaxID=195883 RepID=A0A482XMZ3_LAOST|nr:hypothetical protein LSTR_LSTR014154 [Laodelphax striatellus]